ncbi:hypothetical protein KC333_g214 [Hortaea werneckii]|nr:hypothetical protein KC333_g214 [Hortaea werneckii]
MSHLTAARDTQSSPDAYRAIPIITACPPGVGSDIPHTPAEMRPIRFLLTLATCILTFFLLLFIGPWRASTQEDLEERSNLRTYFNWRTPSSLFPPSAIISLTDDNSTFFLARPAAFGPVLPTRSLSGQLWVGSGFADDHLRGDGRPDEHTEPSGGRRDCRKGRSPEQRRMWLFGKSQVGAEKRRRCADRWRRHSRWSIGHDVCSRRYFQCHDTGSIHLSYNSPPAFEPHTAWLGPRRTNPPERFGGRYAKFHNYFCSCQGNLDTENQAAGQSRAAGEASTRTAVVHRVAEIVEDGSAGKRTSSAASSAPVSTKTPDRSSEDGFVIGVQDWRDPDLVAEQKERQKASTDSSTSLSSTVAGTTRVPKHGPKGGSIMPGSGEYGKGVHEAVNPGVVANEHTAKQETTIKNPKKQSSNWLLRLFSSESGMQGVKADPVPTKTATKAQDPTSRPTKAKPFHQQHEVQDDFPRHDGLWVTLTPTSMSSSPFFDTLLVLVVSPLVTLTVVYALLLLRSRIRRRRWRAPKSVVERLPVRTYQTMPSTTSSSSSTISAVSAPAVSAATPLLPSSARPISTRSRPRARTASEIPAQNSSLRSGESIASPSLDEVEEKRAAGLAEWRRRYGGRQRECVVCLEEYVDGVSRVMSLPCGHEFHEGCITPWLTTRRRTCPICKGDVVRSLARNHPGASASSSSPPPLSQPPHPPPQQYHDDPAEQEEGEVQEQVATSGTPDPAAAQQPVSRADEDLEDLERGGWR